MSKYFPFLITTLFFLSVIGCKEGYSPKPYGYFRIDFPEKSYHQLNENLPYSFAIADSAFMEEDTTYDAEPFWINIVYKAYNAEINISYKPITTDSSFAYLMQDSHHLAYAHTSKADAINERYFHNEETRIFGLMYLIEGNTASPAQFFVTDSVRHFIRGALYLRERPNRDSLAPIINYLKEDIAVLMETMSFR
ncbi:gliding motility lipoprotein GldD [Odoribacter sp. OttesenSCG-928-J03]|nr:gliding motility lipoprotein GldD [Odoribacter sp. OttesenSCG-928-J03]MDL2331249.1 gliding motility lipoprotein GldD [Odoribacter sp. OttesenSCG-928-A06]